MDEELLLEGGDFNDVGAASGAVAVGGLAIRVSGGRSPVGAGEDEEKPGGFRPVTTGDGAVATAAVCLACEGSLGRRTVGCWAGGWKGLADTPR